MRSPQRLLPPVILGAAAAAAFALSYGCWPDVLVDTGRELYVPWRILQGQVLYRDIACFNGPLSPYLNAAAMALMGVSMRSLVIVNCLVIAAVIAMLYWLARQFAGRFASTLAGLTFIAFFAFSQYTPFGGYNWVFPYSHEMTHGIALALASLCALAAAAPRKTGQEPDNVQQRKTTPWLLIAGLALGLSFLTKPEIFVAAAATNLLALAFLLPRSKRRLRDGAAWLLGALAPVALAAILLGGPAAIGAWRYVGSQLHVGQAFYRNIAGIDHPWRNLLLIFEWSGIYLAAFGFAALTGFFGWRRRSRLYGVILFALVIGFIEIDTEHGGTGLAWFAAPLPLAMLGLTVWFVATARRRADRSQIARLGWAALGLTLLGKTVLNTNIFHYGFALAAPAAALTAAALFDTLPGVIQRAGGSRWPVLGVALALWIGAERVYGSRSLHWFALDTVALGDDGDRFLASGAPGDRGKPVKGVLEKLAGIAQPGDTLAVLPEGVSINYLARIPNPTPYINFMPVELSMFGQDNILAALRAHPPQFIVLVDKDTSEYGPKHFGRDYGQPIFQWVLDHYDSLGVAGGRPFYDEGFGVMLLQRKKTFVTLRP